jgi:hypothetical protein
MLRAIGLISLPLLLLLASPASAVTYKQKMETCKFGADDQKLAGAKRNAFIKKCMGKGNYQPAARKDAIKKAKAAKKPATKKTTAAKPAAPTAPKPDAQKQ